MPRPTREEELVRSITDEVLYGRPSDHLKVFVSSKMRDDALKAERAAAIQTIDALPWHRAWAWEKSSIPGPYSAVKVCVREAETSDEIVLIVDDELTRVTQREYRAAKRGGAARFVLLKDRDVHPMKVKQFIDRERRGKTVTGTFKNLPELRSLIRKSLRGYSIRTHRVAVVRERKSLR